MQRYRLDPEVAGSLGDQTVRDRSVWPPRAEVFHYEFQGWMGDCIIESMANYIVTERLADDFQRHNFTGFEIAEVLVTVDEQVAILGMTLDLPKFVWLKITGDENDDFTREADRRLSVSKQALDVIQEHGASDLIVTPVETT